MYAFTMIHPFMHSHTHLVIPTSCRHINHITGFLHHFPVLDAQCPQPWVHCLPPFQRIHLCRIQCEGT